jgi:hypothetical protein
MKAQCGGAAAHDHEPGEEHTGHHQRGEERGFSFVGTDVGKDYCRDDDSHWLYFSGNELRLCFRFQVSGFKLRLWRSSITF